jgi:hypothetical protein
VLCHVTKGRYHAGEQASRQEQPSPTFAWGRSA